MKKSILFLLILISTMSFSQKKVSKTATATPRAPISLTDDQKASYYIGMNIAENLKNQGFNIDADLLSKGLKDKLSGGNTLLSADGMNAFMMEYSKKMNEKKMAEQKVKAEANKKEGIAFLENNKKNANIKTTASGLQYEVLNPGDGKSHPVISDIVNVIYTGKLLNGTVFDSTDKNGGKPIDIPLSNVIKGWQEGIQLMSKGAKYKMYIPADLAYGDNGAGNVIPPGSTIVFDVELVDFHSPAESSKPVQAIPAAKK